MIRGTLEIGFGSGSDARKALAALKSEAVDRERSRVSLGLKGRALVLRVDADDVVALRASLNTYLRLLSVVMAGLREGI